MESARKGNDSRSRHLAAAGARVGGPRRALMLVAASCAVAALGFACPASADPPNAPDAGAYTTNGPVYAIARAAGRTYVGGDFTRVGLRSGPGAILSSAIPSSADGYRKAFPEVAGGDVRAVASDGAGGWYIGGSFTFVGGEAHVGLAHVNADGSVDHGFSPAATDLHGTPAAVDALAYSRNPDRSNPWPDDGTLYVGGEFSKIGLGSGQIHGHVAVLHGTDGSPITAWGPTTDCTTSGCSAAVRALSVAHVPLTVSGATQAVPVVFVGGDFSRAGPSDGPKPIQGLAAIWGANAFDSAGSPIGGSLVTDASSPPSPWMPFTFGTPAVRALKVSPDSSATFAVYAGGTDGTKPVLEAHQFKISNPASRAVDNTGPRFARWSPNPQNCSTPGCVPSVNALALNGSTLYFAGDFSKINSPAIDTKRLAKIGPVPDLTNPNAGTTVNATAMPGADGGPIRALAMASDGSALYMGGDFTQRLAAVDPGTGNPSAWAPEPDGPAEALATDASTPFVYAGGRFSSLGAVVRNGLAAFDSGGGLVDWAPSVESGPGSPPPLVRALAASDGTVYVGGQFDHVTRPGGTQNEPNLAAIDAGSGDPRPASSFDPAPSLNGGDPAEVLSLALLNSTLYVGGRFDAIGMQSRRNLAALDAGTGMATPWDPTADDNVYSILPACGAIYVGGAFSHVGPQLRNAIAAIDPTSGSATPWDPDAGGAVFALARFGPTIYAGGNFANIGGELRQNTAGLTVGDGSATGFDPAGNGPVRALAVSDSALYVGGVFTGIGGASRNNLAGLDPGTGQATAWNPGPDGTVRALAVGDGALYAGGQFATVATAAQQGFAPFGSGAGSPFVPSSCVGPAGGASLQGASGTATTSPAPGAVRTGRPTPSARITRLTVSPARLRLGGAPLTVRFTLSRAAVVRLRFERRVRARWARFADVTGRANRGLNRVSFRGQRVGRRRLVPGRYRVVITTVPPPRGAPVRQGFFTVMAR